MKTSSWIGLTVLGCAAVFVVGFSIRDFANGRLPSAQTFRSAFGSSSPALAQDEVQTAYSQISSDATSTVDPKTLKYAALSGMVASLGDPHTVFMPPKDLKSFDATTSANFFGIGCSLLGDPRGVKIEKVFDNGAAAKVGIKAGDIITAVDGKSIQGMNATKVVDRIRGKEGTSVSLKVLPQGKPPARIVNPVRGRVFVPTVVSHYFPQQQVGYIAVSTFSEPTPDQFNTELAKLQTKPLKGLIIDMRSNPGGLLAAACDMVGRFVGGKLVVTMHGRDGVSQTAKSPTGEVAELHVPIAILIDQNTASAAEIFSGVMHDYGKATLVGNHSYGKASVQNLFPLIDGAGLKVTIARYSLPFTPDIGKKVDADGNYVSGGLHPDILVKMPPDATPKAYDLKSDPQLAAAMKYLTTGAESTQAPNNGQAPASN